MFCVKCGKQVEHDERLCNECQQAENAQKVQPVTEIEQEKPTEVTVCRAENAVADKRGFGYALAAIIVAPIAWIMGLIFVSEIQYGIDAMLMFGADAASIYEMALNGVNAIAAIVGCIIALVLCTKAFNEQNEALKEGVPRHNPTHVLALVSRILAICFIAMIGMLLLDTVELFL